MNIVGDRVLGATRFRPAYTNCDHARLRHFWKLAAASESQDFRAFRTLFRPHQEWWQAGEGGELTQRQFVVGVHDDGLQKRTSGEGH